MGFLKIYGLPLEWEDSKQYIQKLKNEGIFQIIRWIKSTDYKYSEIPKFGYEVKKINYKDGISQNQYFTNTSRFDFTFCVRF